MNVLLLTKSIQMEKYFIDRLYQLGHEVFCSTELIDKLIKGINYSQFIQYFQGVIFSDNISNHEMNLITTILENKVPLYRKCSEETMKDEQSICEKNEVCILDDSLLDLREKLIIPEKSSMDSSSLLTDTNTLKKLSLSLTRQESIVLDYLIKSNGKTVSKKELVQELWPNKELSQSYSTRISMIIQKLRFRLEQKNQDPEIIKTIWGEGYEINRKL